jgi:hydrogenase/urease accessory protein HupE
MGYAGTAGMVYGWIIAMIFIQCVAMGMGMGYHTIYEATNCCCCC